MTSTHYPYPYPFMPDGRVFEYVEGTNPYILAAKAYAMEHSLDQNHPTGSVIVRNGAIIGHGANGSDYHKTHQCRRALLGIPTGQQYELCEGCHPKNHSEPRAIADASSRGSAQDADLYLWGHWWCCEPCWTAMIAAGIRSVILAKDSYEAFKD